MVKFRRRKGKKNNQTKRVLRFLLAPLSPVCPRAPNVVFGFVSSSTLCKESQEGIAERKRKKSRRKWKGEGGNIKQVTKRNLAWESVCNCRPTLIRSIWEQVAVTEAITHAQSHSTAEYTLNLLPRRLLGRAVFHIASALVTLLVQRLRRLAPSGLGQVGR